MDAIYSGAATVIIAVAGEDPSFGLPGVQWAIRDPQLWVEFGDYVLVWSLDNSLHVINRSKWMDDSRLDVPRRAAIQITTGLH